MKEPRKSFRVELRKYAHVQSADTFLSDVALRIYESLGFGEDGEIPEFGEKYRRKCKCDEGFFLKRTPWKTIGTVKRRGEVACISLPKKYDRDRIAEALEINRNAVVPIN